MASPPVAPIFIHVPLIRSSDPSVVRAEHVVLTMDSPHAAITMHLPTADPMSAAPGAYWDRWIERLRMAPPNVCGVTARARNVLLHIALVYRAVTRRGVRHIDYDLFLYFTDELIAIARAAGGESVNQKLAHLICDTRRLFPITVFSDHDYLCNPRPEPAHPLRSISTFDDERSCGSAVRATPSRSPSPLETVTSDTAVDPDSGYESCDTDSSEEPDPDSEEEALIAQGFIVYE
ncbi:hypothetical protein LXA43DRAFT_1099411 [Ganoderma leucocontextum]|nr:hypothetical protein LXA43DRAFT_1099400 [Ganoderma leucocontextum]KAI1786265.1 hypothetical protein LXA43DRAFT_1099411 [Ganoderma leucocontextum]